MRQAGWGELFEARNDVLVVAPEMPKEPRGWQRLLWWEDLLTFVLLGVMTLTIASSVQSAGWVEEMPSLYPIAFFGLLMGLLLARLPWREGFIHLIALPIGAAAVLGQILSVLPGHYPWDRYDVMQDRMRAWFDTAFGGGISNDELPFIVLVVSLSWLSAYLSSWAIYRWRNVWLAVIPGGTLLLLNISYLPGQFSVAFVVFVGCAILLVSRLNLLERTRAWRASDTPYPTLLSLSVLHATFWLALLLIGAAWLMPRAAETNAMASLWDRTTQPVTERFAPLSRLFVGVQGEKSGRVHDFSDILPLRGGISPSDRVMLAAVLERLEDQQFLRAEVYDQYTAAGWEQHERRVSPVESRASLRDEALQGRERQAVAAQIEARGQTGDAILSVGQPKAVDLPARVELTGGHDGVAALEAVEPLNQGDLYTATGTISTATADQLRAASTSYPDWITHLYTQLPDDYSARVGELARQWTALSATPYDQAAAIETNLRNKMRYGLDVSKPPAGQDAVDYFLFDSQRGYYDQFASAMVVMLRSLGVPSRIAVGYTLQEPLEESATTVRYLVSEQNAFAWPEVYFPGYGWVEFNPTPNLPTFARGGPATVAAASADEAPVPNTAFPSGALGPQFADGPSTLDPIAVEDTSRSYTPWLFAGGAAALLVLLVAAAGGAAFVWLRGLRDLDTPERLWGQTVRLGSWARVPADPSSTPREYAQRLRAEVPDAEEADLLADAYVRHRFGQERLGASDLARLDHAWRRLRPRLLRRLFRLA